MTTIKHASRPGCRRHTMSMVGSLLSLCLIGTLSGFAAAASAVVDRMRGDVQKRGVSQLKWESITPGEKVEEGASLKSGPDSEAVLVTDQGHQFILRPNTTLAFTSLRADQTQARLESGRVRSKVKKLKANEAFSLQTPTAVCAVRGTEFDTAAGDKGTIVSVYHGVVGVAIPGGMDEVRIPAGQMTSVQGGRIEAPRPIPQEKQGGTESGLTQAARHEVGLDMDRNQVIAAAAMEMRMAEYLEGKSLIDVSGKRVRLEEYIVRPQADQFKLVVLNHRDEKLDYFFYKGTFNQDLPGDLSVALRDLSGKVGAEAPDYYLTAYEMGQSNTQDSVHDTATGGHLVQIAVNADGDYVLTDPTAPSNTRTIEQSELQSDGTYKVYDPLSDSFSYVSESQLSAATRFGVYLPENDTFKDLVPGDTLWKTRFNAYSHAINNNAKISWTKSGATNVLASTLDATWTYAGGFMLQVVEPDANKIDATVTAYYGDNTFERYRTVLIDDEGRIAPRSAFASVATGAEYKGELLKWNYQQQVTATEFEGRKIDLVVEPKIFIKSGLIQ